MQQRKQNKDNYRYFLHYLKFKHSYENFQKPDKQKWRSITLIEMDKNFHIPTSTK